MKAHDLRLQPSVFERCTLVKRPLQQVATAACFVAKQVGSNVASFYLLSLLNCFEPAKATVRSPVCLCARQLVEHGPQTCNCAPKTNERAALIDRSINQLIGVRLHPVGSDLAKSNCPPHGRGRRCRASRAGLPGRTLSKQVASEASGCEREESATPALPGPYSTATRAFVVCVSIFSFPSFLQTNSGLVQVSS